MSAGLAEVLAAAGVVLRPLAASNPAAPVAVINFLRFMEENLFGLVFLLGQKKRRG
jgi:hypothetical protein